VYMCECFQISPSLAKLPTAKRVSRAVVRGDRAGGSQRGRGEESQSGINNRSACKSISPAGAVRAIASAWSTATWREPNWDRWITPTGWITEEALVKMAGATIAVSTPNGLLLSSAVCRSTRSPFILSNKHKHIRSERRKRFRGTCAAMRLAA
jgi:hypothetical protein